MKAAALLLVLVGGGGAVRPPPPPPPPHGHDDGHLKLAGAAGDRHPRAPWHNQQNQHAYRVSGRPDSLPPLDDVSPLNQRARHAARRVREGNATAPGPGRSLQGMVPATPGSVASTACAVLSGACAVPTATTSSTSTTISLSYALGTGVFSGAVVTNQCPQWPADFQYNGSLITHPVPASCVQQTFPGTAYAFPAALPLGGRIGLALRSGENLYSSLEQGFTLGQACRNGLGTCAAGADLTFCKAQLEVRAGCVTLAARTQLERCARRASSVTAGRRRAQLRVIYAMRRRTP